MNYYDAYRKGTYLLYKKLKYVGREMNPQDIINEMEVDPCYRGSGTHVILFSICFPLKTIAPDGRRFEVISVTSAIPVVDKMVVPAKYMNLKKEYDRGSEHHVHLTYQYRLEEGGKIYKGAVCASRTFLERGDSLASICSTTRLPWHKEHLLTDKQWLSYFLRRKINY